MPSLEAIALCLGVANGFFLLVRPIGRIHSRIDALEYQANAMIASLQRIENRLEREIERMER